MLKNQEGSTLAMVIIIASILILLSVTLNFITVSEAKQSIYQQKKTQAYYIARSGAVTTAKWIINMNSDEIKEFVSMDFPIYSSLTDFGEGFFEVKIDKKDKKITITSMGKVLNSNNQYITNDVTLVLNQQEIEGNALDFEYVAFADEGIEMKGKSFINGNMGTNSGEDSIDNIDIEKIKGEVFYNCNIEYLTPILPKIPKDLEEKNGGNIDLMGPKSKTIDSNNGYDKINIGAGSTLIIDANHNDINIKISRLNNEGMIKVVGDKKVSIFVEDILNLKKKSSIRRDEGEEEQTIIYYYGDKNLDIDEVYIDASLYLDDTDLIIGKDSFIGGSILSSGSKVEYRGGRPNSDVGYSGLIYAPNAEIIIGTHKTVRGAVVGKNIEVKNECKLIYDPSFVNKIPIKTEGSSNYTYEIDHWE